MAADTFRSQRRFQDCFVSPTKWFRAHSGATEHQAVWCCPAIPGLTRPFAVEFVSRYGCRRVEVSPMPTPSARAVAERLKALLPPDGTPVLNRVLRVMLSRDFGQPVSDQLYEQARDQLFVAGQIGRLRGQGGQGFFSK